jgi:hypothetical protein
MRSSVFSLQNHVLLLAIYMSRPQGSYGPPTFVSGRPQNGRPSDIAVATSPPSTTDAQVSVATTASGGMLVSATEVANTAAFQYPLGLLTINNIDSVVVDYQSPWSSATLSVSCSGDGVGGSKSFDISLRELWRFPIGDTMDG